MSINDISNCVQIPVEHGVIYTKTLTDYDNLIGDISREGIIEFAELVKDLFADGDEVKEQIDKLVEKCTGAKGTEMLFLNDRVMLAKMYYEWIYGIGLVDTPVNLIAFLQTKELIKEHKARELLNEVTNE